MLLCAKPINTPHTKEPRAAPGAGNCIQNWSWLRGRYNHTTQENVQRKYKNVVVKEACRHATYKGARGDPCHRKLHPKVRPVAQSRPGLLYSRHMSPNLYLCEGICRYDICTDVKILLVCRQKDCAMYRTLMDSLAEISSTQFRISMLEDLLMDL